ncbi:MAG: ATP-dependent DNA ligase [Puniceicoccaceae bacterium]|nr:MAG: ATP-dependent DNA ligase [Puniceicoccaceae bacterium]
MRRFTELYMELDASNRKTVKLAALKRYFAEVPAEDGAWAVFFLTGQRLKRPIKLQNFREWAGAICGYPAWMVEACYDHVGDLAETLALLLADVPSEAGEGVVDWPLHRLVETVIAPLRDLEPEVQRARVTEIWAQLDGESCFIFNKLITGGFRVGVSQTIVSAALADLAGVAPAVMAHRLMGTWRPTAADYRALFSGESMGDAVAKPYPFCLAYPLDTSAREALGPIQDWQIEWKWDGIRAQLIKRDGAVVIWSRGEALVTEQFPEVVEAAADWPDSVVLDGELLVWSGADDRPAPFSELQRRLGRKTVGPKLRREAPVIFMAYDLLELAGEDLRERSGAERRNRLEAWAREVSGAGFRLSPLITADSWAALAELREASRSRRVEGLMLKRKTAAYHTGRKKGDWWKWKVAPHTVDAVMVYAQQGHGRRAGLYTDYTFSVWWGDQLLPIAKAYSGLSDAEIRQVDRWIRQNTLDSHGPVRVVRPELVFEIAFEGILESKRHKSGLAVRFPRILRWRADKTAGDADSLQQMRGLLAVS